MSQSSEKKQPLTSYTIFLEAVGLYSRTARQTLKLAVFFLFLPQFVYFLALSGMSGSYVEDGLRRADPALGIAPLADLAVSFFGYFFLATVILLLLSIPAVMAMLKLAVTAYCERRVMGLREALRGGRFKGFFFLSLLVGFLAAFEQGVFGPFPVITMLATMAFVIMWVERRSPLSALSQAVFLRYTSPTTGGAFGAFLVLTTVAIFIFGVESSLSYLGACVLSGDEILGAPRSVWAWQFLGFPFTYAYLFTMILEIFLRSLILSFLPSFCVCLYYTVRPKFSQRI